MRINLQTPFAEKDAAKALGARWDSGKKQWYIVDVEDLTPFLRWIPNMEAATAVDFENTALTGKPTAEKGQINRSAGVITASARKVPFCGCQVHAWEDCPHTTESV